MKTEIFFVKSLEEYLRNIIQPILKTPLSLKSGKKYTNMKLTSREVLGAFLICLTIKHISGQDWTIVRDPEYGDGVIWCRDPNRNSEGVFLEQVYVRLRPSGFSIQSIIERINAEIKKKVDKGKQYAMNRHLVVFLDAEGLFDHQRIKQYIEGIQERFDSYWLFAPYSQSGSFDYIVFLLKAERDQPAAYKVTINNDFRGWEVQKIGRL